MARAFPSRFHTQTQLLGLLFASPFSQDNQPCWSDPQPWSFGSSCDTKGSLGDPALSHILEAARLPPMALFQPQNGLGWKGP